MLQFVIQEVTTEFIKKGQKGYSVATVVHTYNGQNRTHKVMSFKNPEVYNTVKDLKQGAVINVEVSKNEAGYNEWTKIVVGEAEDKVPVKSGKVVGSNYETPEERAKRQVLIVRQSCLSNAVAYYKDTRTSAVENVSEDEILETAQRFVDWVFDAEPVDETTTA